MTKEKRESCIIYILLFITAGLFCGFGLFHIAQFETTDEHLWKYDRIPQYWQALTSAEWEDTYINDKPGVTVALISGIGLLLENEPTKDKVLDTTNPNGDLYEIYKPSEVLRLNYAFRLPVLFFSTLSLFLFFYLAYHVFNSRWLALITTITIALNPIILGISQIINPDSFFWIGGGLASFSYIALLRKSQKKFLYTCIIFTGFALLSKYTAVTLFIFYALALFAHIIYEKEDENIKKNTFIAKNTIFIAIIFIASIALFILFIPAIFVEPKLLIKGISQFMSLKEALLMIFFIAILAVIMHIKKDLYPTVISFLQRKNVAITWIVSILFLFVIFFSLANVLTDQTMIPFDALKDRAYANEPKDFNFKPYYAEDTKLWKKTKLYFMESYPFIFSLTPITFLLIIYISLRSFSPKISPRSLQIYIPIASFFLIYFLLTVMARIVTNVRYSIVLYPLIALLVTVALYELHKQFFHEKKKFFMIISVILITTGSFTLYTLKPFYFSYASPLLPKKFSIHDSWGHGSYEAAQHLNSLENAADLVIWSNSKTVCAFFDGKCLRSRKIDLNEIEPDYFVISKRGEIKERNHFTFLNKPKNIKDSTYYFDNLHTKSIWDIHINDRPDNYITIIPFEK